VIDSFINTGDLRTSITFQVSTLTPDPGSAQIASWANVSTNPTVLAWWVNAHRDKVISNEMLKYEQRATVTIRYRSDILPTWRIVKDGQHWQILSIDDVNNRHRYMELIVELQRGAV
jgi:SPP1 family predicted phage head-tail adaptor